MIPIFTIESNETVALANLGTNPLDIPKRSRNECREVPLRYGSLPRWRTPIDWIQLFTLVDDVSEEVGVRLHVEGMREA